MGCYPILIIRISQTLGLVFGWEVKGICRTPENLKFSKSIKLKINFCNGSRKLRKFPRARMTKRTVPLSSSHENE